MQVLLRQVWARKASALSNSDSLRAAQVQALSGLIAQSRVCLPKKSSEWGPRSFRLGHVRVMS
jgi:hypothetical protein